MRQTRKIHRWSGITLFIFMIIVGLTSVLLGWKKHSGGYLLAATSSGVGNQPGAWISLDSIQQIAIHYQQQRGMPHLAIDRIDVRPGNGIAKVLFLDKYEALQVDLTSGQVLLEEKRRSDFIEQLHDGSIVDDMLGWKSGLFKLVYSTTLGLALVLFSLTGFWLWFGPRRMRR